MRIQTGLGLLVRRGVANHSKWAGEYRPSIGSRPRIMLAEAQLALSNAPTALIAVNHWKSRMSHAGSAMTPEQDRNETARWLGELLAQRDKYDPVIVMGDFNAEPWEPPFGEFRLRGKRTFSGALWSGSTPAYLYNTAWRFAPEPDLWENKLAAGNTYRESRPKNTHSAAASPRWRGCAAGGYWRGFGFARGRGGRKERVELVALKLSCVGLLFDELLDPCGGQAGRGKGTVGLVMGPSRKVAEGGEGSVDGAGRPPLVFELDEEGLGVARAPLRAFDALTL